MKSSRQPVALPATLKIGIVTWNVGNEEPFSGTQVEKLNSLIPEGLEIFVIGVQECKYKKGSNAEEDSDDEELDQPKSTHTVSKKPEGESSFLMNKFDKVIKEAGKKAGLVILKRAQLLEMRILVLVHPSLKKHISDIRVAVEATGLMGVYGNKGGIGVCFNLDGTRLGFLNTHLAAHLHQLPLRNKNIHEILAGTHCYKNRIELSYQLDHFFWLGDLNYRIDLNIAKVPPGEKPEKISTKSEEHVELWNKTKELVDQKDWAQLQGFDQLRAEVSRRAVFCDFREGTLNFNPTFKVKRARQLDAALHDSFVYTEQRMPSWCDRVLWHSMPAVLDNVEQQTLEPLPDINTSDHKPIRSVFRVTRSPNPVLFGHRHEELQLRLSNLVVEGPELEERQGLYLGLKSYPPAKGNRHLVSPLVTPPKTKPDWSDSPISLQVDVLDDYIDYLQLLIVVMDDKIGKDESVGICALPLKDVRAAQSPLQFSTPLILNSRDTGLVLKCEAQFVRDPSDPNWSATAGKQPKLSIKQRF